MLETKRLILRRWEENDAENLYRYASDPDVGPIAGWPVHRSIEESREVIKTVFNGKEAYAICLKTDHQAIGAIELKLNGHTDMTSRDDECELGYWLGKPFWGQGIVPEAAEEMLRHAFADCGMTKVWAGYYDGNTKSKRVQEKCGFIYQRTTKDLDVPLLHEKRTGHSSMITKEDWLRKQEIWDLYDRDGNRTGETFIRGFGNFMRIPEGRYHLGVDILVLHADGTYLMTKRSETKDVYPGYWEASAGGSAVQGEEPLEAAKRELYEETGLVPDSMELVNVLYKDASRTVFYSYLARVTCDKASVVLQEGETTDYKWIDQTELLAYVDSDEAITSHNQRFAKYIDSLR